MADSPCRKCDKRTAECHAVCGEYKAFREAKDLEYRLRANDECSLKYLQERDTANKEKYLKKKKR